MYNKLLNNSCKKKAIQRTFIPFWIEIVRNQYWYHWKAANLIFLRVPISCFNDFYLKVMDILWMVSFFWPHWRLLLRGFISNRDCWHIVFGSLTSWESQHFNNIHTASQWSLSNILWAFSNRRFQSWTLLAMKFLFFASQTFQ